MIEASARAGRQGERDKLLLTLIYRHGLRVSEAVVLRWTDFDLDASKARPFHVRRVKGSKDSVRTLEPDTARLLNRLRGEADGPYVFRSELGGPMSVDAVQVIVARAGREARLRFKVHPHMLRHACGFFLAEQAIDTRPIQDYLGPRIAKSQAAKARSSCGSLATTQSIVPPSSTSKRQGVSEVIATEASPSVQRPIIAPSYSVSHQPESREG